MAGIASAAGRTSWWDLLRLEWGPYPFTPGRLFYLWQRKYGAGLPVTYWRDVRRPRLIGATPVAISNTGPVEIHTLVSSADWLNLLWALRSFYATSGRDYPLCIHDDGTLSPAATVELRRAFPHARLIPRAEADARLAESLAPYPRCAELRRTNMMSLKGFDFPAFLECERMLIFDSDVLFFHEPTRLLNALEHSPRNALNRDWRNGYTVDEAVVAPLLDFKLQPLINAGLGLLHRASLRFDWMEEFLTLPDVYSHHHCIEQTLTALCSCRYGFEMLPPEYDIEAGPRDPKTPSRHYSGPMRPLMYSEGIRDLVRSGLIAA